MFPRRNRLVSARIPIASLSVTQDRYHQHSNFSQNTIQPLPQNTTQRRKRKTNVGLTSLKTLLPHHPSNPFNQLHPGYKKQKNTTTTPIARPESKAAESVMVYFPHQAGLRRRRWELKRKQIRAQVEKLSPVCVH